MGGTYFIRVKDKKMSFSSAHFVEDVSGIERLHGHNYEVTVEIEHQLNDFGMVMDFREVKQKVAEICKELDHRILLPTLAENLTIQLTEDTVDVTWKHKQYLFPKEDCCLLPISATTAERLAEYIASKLDVVGKHITVCVSESSGSEGCYSFQAQFE